MPLVPDSVWDGASFLPNSSISRGFASCWASEECAATHFCTYSVEYLRAAPAFQILDHAATAY